MICICFGYTLCPSGSMILPLAITGDSRGNHQRARPSEGKGDLWKNSRGERREAGQMALAGTWRTYRNAWGIGPVSKSLHQPLLIPALSLCHCQEKQSRLGILEH